MSCAWEAPGRINIIGEHTDYNEGFVLPIALPNRTIATAASRADGRLTVRSAQRPGEQLDSRIIDLTPGSVPGWAGYPAGVLWALRAAGHELRGVDLAVDGAVPLGAGLSSSAALECAVAAAVNDLFDLRVPPAALALIAQRAENDFVGVPCGIMDQMAAMLCTAGHALFLDTRTLSTEQVPLDLPAAGLALLVVNTKAPHRLVEGEYAKRRRSCEEAAARLGVAALRDIAADRLPDALAALADDLLCRRTRHVVTENVRVLDAVAKMRAGAVRDIGPVLTASHVSLRDDYEVSSVELDAAVDAALSAGALGARMAGGGFGGCAIALVEKGGAAAVEHAVAAAFTMRGLQPPAIFAATPSRGAGRSTR